jgi:hypothetical protein
MSKASSWFSRYLARGKLGTLDRWMVRKTGIHSLGSFCPDFETAFCEADQQGNYRAPQQQFTL